jgi:transcription elongation factor Elf1
MNLLGLHFSVKVMQTFIRCPNCGRLKNANYKAGAAVAAATCLCGTKLEKRILNKPKGTKHKYNETI